MQSKKPVVFWCEHSFQIYAALPIARKYYRRGYPIVLFTSPRYVQAARDYFDFGEVEVRSIAKYRSRVGNYVTNKFREYFTPIDFSPLYYVRLGYRKKTMNRVTKMTNRLLSKHKVHPNHTYNRIVERLYRLRILEPIDLDPYLFFTFTKVHHAYVAVPFNDRHVCVMESWDHPSKEPYLLSPRRALTWNTELAEETREFQNYDMVHTIAPLKFRYIEEFATQSEEELLRQLTDPLLLQDLERMRNQKYLIYPMCTSSDYWGFGGELKFVEELCQVLKNSDYRLYIRPYPLAPASDREQLEALDDKVIVGSSSYGTDGTEVMNTSLQIHKYLITKWADLVINTGTTYVFDAALCDVPIVQIYFDKNSTTDFHRTINEQIHLQKYLINEFAIKYDPNTLLRAVEVADPSFTARIKSWLLSQ